MKNTTKQSRFKYLFIAIPVLLCAVIVSLTVFLPKEKAASNKNTVSSNKNIVSTDITTELSQKQTELAAPQQAISQEKGNPVKYRLVYALENQNDAQTWGTPRKSDNLVNGYLKRIVADYEDQDVYFRVTAVPTAVWEEILGKNFAAEDYAKIYEQRMEYIKELGAMDIVDMGGNQYCMTVTAEMINKIGEAGGCYLYIAYLPRISGYSDKIPDALAYTLENMKEEETVTVKFGLQWPNSTKTEKELFDKFKIRDEQIITKEYHEEEQDTYYGPMLRRYTFIEGSFTKQQIKDISPYVEGWIKPVGINNITIIDVTQDMELPL